MSTLRRKKRAQQQKYLALHSQNKSEKTTGTPNTSIPKV
jgi:hypothetical protein